MKDLTYSFSGKQLHCLFDAAFNDIERFCNKENSFIITDEVVYSLHRNKFNGYKVICIKAGENNKNQDTVDNIIEQLLQQEADKQSWIIAVGGGVVTDVGGYVASIYKRGVHLGLVPTTILGMVDAALGGKNGVNVGVYKNMVGTIYQPEFVLFDGSFLETLPVVEWVNGFAEIIKHACIKDALLFSALERYDLHQIQADITLMADLIEQNVAIKMEIVTTDEYEKADRKLLNFGHTFGHAIENLHSIPHGQAVSIGIVAACNLSEKINHLHFEDAQRVVRLLAKYHLPVDIETDHSKVFEVLKLDKKRADDQIHFVLLNKIGEAEAKPVSMKFIEEQIKSIL